MMPKGKYYEYQVKKAALDDDLLAGHIDEVQYARESLDLDLKYEGYITPKNDAKRKVLRIQSKKSCA